MKALNYGSLNIDFVYNVEHFVRSGETISSQNMAIFAGGKGLNQSVALAKSGIDTWHAGNIGEDGEFLAEILQKAGAHTDFITRSAGQKWPCYHTKTAKRSELHTAVRWFKQAEHKDTGG